ncbi:TetR/AcrR family transcriptional regulator [Nocardia cyriacigeorgica]|uniref:TetR/AcrR family transcriptional regulator n=1 Tax=Nocardia cyriacigeorgica TaxID=135487 RepID=UPI0009DB28C6|nr:TetR/AcrR family transcriptional regulator [Nocardia cyriacigeorgica]MBF6285947.1 TetR/AcrR family transcriptional regulator [Nocardia cyriacigeorgica]BDU08402.1 TetR family transcriptional regulator [Nocardia cyriacigeorgica]
MTARARAAAGPGRRQPQNENGVATHQRILDAALDVLATRGWRHASVAEVAERAGVTRGAVQHHFKDREGLFTAAVQQIMDSRVREVENLQHADYPEGERTQAIVRTVVELHQGQMFTAALQLCVAASNDPILRPRIAAMELEVGARAFWTLIELLRLDGNDRTVRTTVQAFLDSARGLGLAGMLNDDSRRRGYVADRWAEMLDELRTDKRD